MVQKASMSGVFFLRSFDDVLVAGSEVSSPSDYMGNLGTSTKVSFFFLGKRLRDMS